MEVSPALLLTLKNEPIQVFDKIALKWIVPRNNPGFADFVNQIGLESAKSQDLKRPLTTFLKLVEGDDEQKLYIFWQKNPDISKGPLVYGYVKTTRKQLYLRDSQSQLFVHTPLCVSDFYVVDWAHKLGHGVKLFDFVLENEKITAGECAFDNPPKPVLAFLEKHYHLSDPIWQSIRFVVFKQFFEQLEPQQEAHEYSSNLNSRASSRRSSFGKSPVPTSNRKGVYSDNIADIIHPSGLKQSEARVLPAGTAQAFKYSRDFTHQNIW